MKNYIEKCSRGNTNKETSAMKIGQDKPKCKQNGHVLCQTVKEVQ